MQEGQVRPGNVLKVDCFLNHQLDVDLLDKVGEELYRSRHWKKSWAYACSTAWVRHGPLISPASTSPRF